MEASCSQQERVEVWFDLEVDIEEQVLEAVRCQWPGAWLLSAEEAVRQIGTIIQWNMDSGRAQRVARRYPRLVDADEIADNQTRPPGPLRASGLLQEYVTRVIRRYHAEHPRIQRLADRDLQEWQGLLQLLTARGYQKLLRFGRKPSRACEEAHDFAQDAAEIICGAWFPYDVPFEAWAGLILNNCILQSLTRSRDLMDREPVLMTLDSPPLNEATPHAAQSAAVAAASSKDRLEILELRDSLQHAILTLRSPSQQYVLVATFFEGLDDEEIAHNLAKSKGAVHILRHRALHGLRDKI